MVKELIISLSIFVLIFIGNTITDNYTKKSVDETSSYLSNLKEELIKDEGEIDFNFAKNKIDEIHRDWDLKYEKLAFYIEHDELEKVETELTALRSFIESKEALEALPELDKSVFILEHIKDKSDFNLKNIF